MPPANTGREMSEGLPGADLVVEGKALAELAVEGEAAVAVVPRLLSCQPWILASQFFADCVC